MTLPPRAQNRLRGMRGSPRPPAIVLDCSYVNGLSAVRQLAGAGPPVVALDHRPQALGLRSRLAVPVVCPNPAVDEPGFAALLGEVVEVLGGRAVAFPTHDDHLVAVNRANIRGLILPFGPPELIEPIQSKRFQYEAAQRAGVGLPLTFHPRSETEAREAAGLHWPAYAQQ